MVQSVTVQSVTVLGATGTIGVNTLDVVARHPERFRIFALTANHRVEALHEQCRRFRPRYAVLQQESDATRLQQALRSEGLPTEVLAGERALAEVASHPEVNTVMAAIVGAAGLKPTLAAVFAGKKILLANKESLVMAGHLFMEAVERSGARLIPIDSEHNAIFQCLPPAHATSAIRRILLTGSGGPFRTLPAGQLAAVTPEQACNHPNWVMGRKISVDSATLMNKGLELIEACWLFATDPSRIRVVIHPQSIIHSMVQYEDGSTLAQMGNPDMRTPIAYGLAWPDRIDSGVADLDFFAMPSLGFETPDEVRFPCLRLAREAFLAGKSAAAVLNAANEVTVEAFLAGKIRFTDIARINEAVLTQSTLVEPDSIDVVIAADHEARRLARELF